jgi:hypothetical protein
MSAGASDEIALHKDGRLGRLDDRCFGSEDDFEGR